MSTLRVDNLNARTGTKITVPTGTTLYAPGHVVQVVQNTLTTSVTTTSTSFANTGLVASITPIYANSKILVTTNMSIRSAQTGNYAGGGIRLVRNLTGSDTTIVDSVADGSGPYSFWTQAGGASSVNILQMHTINYLDSPGTTSSLTYRTQGRLYSSSVTYIYFNPSDNNTGTATIVLMEIAQ